MIAHLIAALIGNYMTTCFVIGLIVGAVQILRDPGHHSGTVISGRLLGAFLFWAVGVAQAVNFVMHSVFGDFAAKTIGWAQSPFQLELAFASLGIAWWLSCCTAAIATSAARWLWSSRRRSSRTGPPAATSTRSS